MSGVVSAARVPRPRGDAPTPAQFGAYNGMFGYFNDRLFGGTIPAWHARKAKHEATVKAAQALIDAARAEMPATVKPDMRPAWLHDKLTEE